MLRDDPAIAGFYPGQFGQIEAHVLRKRDFDSAITHFSVISQLGCLINSLSITFLSEVLLSPVNYFLFSHGLPL